MTDSYRALLGRAHARVLVAALCAAWLSFGMVGLALFLTVMAVNLVGDRLSLVLDPRQRGRP